MQVYCQICCEESTYVGRSYYRVDSGSVAIQCGTLIDGVAATPRDDVTVVIRRGRISSIESGRAAPRGLPILDLASHTCLPGLIDTHTHIPERSEDTADLRVYLYPHGLNARQFKVMVECGMTPMEAIKSATSVAARAMGWPDKVGELTPGRFGDVIAIKGDLLSDVRRLQDVAVVVKGRVIFKR